MSKNNFQRTEERAISLAVIVVHPPPLFARRLIPISKSPSEAPIERVRVTDNNEYEYYKQERNTPTMHEKMYCIMCGNEAEKTTVTCAVHNPVFLALHDFVSQWERSLPINIRESILKAPYQYDPRTGKQWREEETNL